ncbi:hypothetical protein ACRQ1B_25200 [Rhizobium panacihumi]|uniref:hypothetical protein n=1 Tax=Rhizobium panacihumi TaxID=2008450 RepID=UPI003D7C09A8
MITLRRDFLTFITERRFALHCTSSLRQDDTCMNIPPDRYDITVFPPGFMVKAAIDNKIAPEETKMNNQKAPAEKNQNDLHAPLRPLGIKAVIAATMMLKRKPAKKS